MRNSVHVGVDGTDRASRYDLDDDTGVGGFRNSLVCDRETGFDGDGGRSSDRHPHACIGNEATGAVFLCGGTCFAQVIRRRAPDALTNALYAGGDGEHSSKTHNELSICQSERPFQCTLWLPSDLPSRHGRTFVASGQISRQRIYSAPTRFPRLSRH